MHPKRKQRLILVIMLIAGLAIAIGFALMALNQNVNLFFTPTQVANGEAPANTAFRLGGMVVDGSVGRKEDDLTVSFDITDTAKSVTVYYSGILPDLFREGQGIVTLGKLENGEFIAEEVLAKHDENYMPPEAEHAVKEANKKVYQQ